MNVYLFNVVCCDGICILSSCNELILFYLFVVFISKCRIDGSCKKLLKVLFEYCHDYVLYEFCHNLLSSLKNKSKTSRKNSVLVLYNNFHRKVCSEILSFQTRLYKKV